MDINDDTAEKEAVLPKRVLIMGPPGVGKGTHAASLGRFLDAAVVSTGDMFRFHAREQTQLGKVVQRYVDAGDYVPDSVTMDIVSRRLDEPDARAGFVLDGFPRTKAQAEMLDNHLSSNALDRVIVLAAPTQVLVPRLLRRAEIEGRTDDKSEVIHHRIEVYEAETLAVVGLYETRGLVRRVNADDSVGEVFAAICAAASSSS